MGGALLRGNISCLGIGRVTLHCRIRHASQATISRAHTPPKKEGALAKSLHFAHALLEHSDIREQCCESFTTAKSS